MISTSLWYFCTNGYIFSIFKSLIFIVFLWAYLILNCIKILIIVPFRFVAVEHMSAYCYGAKTSYRSDCASCGGKWVPGFDISGHCFLLIYSILIICEEVGKFLPRFELFKMVVLFLWFFLSWFSHWHFAVYPSLWWRKKWLQKRWQLHMK